MSQDSSPQSADPAYKSLYRLAAAAALIVAFLTVVEIIAFIIFPAPSSVRGWFELFQSNPIVGLVDYWGLEVPMYLMFAPVFLGLYTLLRRGSESGMIMALIMTLIGIAIFFATNNPFSMLSLSNSFAAATTDAQRSALLAAGEAIIATTNQRAVGGFNIGLLAFGLSLADYLRQALTSNTIIALLVIVPGAVLLVVWFTLVGARLWQLGHRGVQVPERCTGSDVDGISP
jgi:hypothetical protein